jgi:hypothetical protein
MRSRAPWAPILGAQNNLPRAVPDICHRNLRETVASNRWGYLWPHDRAPKAQDFPLVDHPRPAVFIGITQTFWRG